MKKTILITGSTDGIGKATAMLLAEEGHQLMLHGRSENKLNEVIDQLKERTSNQSIRGFTSDFSDLAAVKRMAQEIMSSFDSIDVLINNAGVFKSPISANSEGVDLRLVVNYLAPVLLTQELLPLLRKSSRGRIINLSSAAQSTVSLSAIEGRSTMSEQEAYAQSKLALLMWSFHLSEQEKGLMAVPVNPGSLLNTRMVQEAYGRYFSEVDKGADILSSLATDEVHLERSGEYFDNDKGDYGKAHPDAYDQQKVEDLISVTESLLKSTYQR